MEELQAAMTKLVKKRQQRAEELQFEHQKQLQEQLLDRQQRAEELQFEHQKQLY